MKTLKYIIPIVACIALLGCSLEEEPYGFLNEENFYQTGNDAESALLYAYAVMPELGYYSRFYYYVAHCSTEEFTQKSDAGAGQHELDGYITNNSTEDLREVFRHAYISINRTFPIIEKAPEISMNEDYKNQIIGEAHFLRALNYYNLVRLFGSVPLRKEAMSDFNSAGQAFAPIEEIYTYIVEDLTTAESLMDNVARRGRANKVAAQGLLANVYLFIASAAESGLEGYSFGGSQYYTMAKDYASKVVNDQSQYGIDNNLFNIFDPETESSPELIFSIIASRVEIGATNMQSLLSTPYVSPYFQLPAEQGGYQIGFGWAHVLVEIPFYNSYSDDDLRKSITFADSYTTESGEEVTYPDGGLSRPFTIKYLDSNRTGGEDSGNRIPIIRYSEVLLTYAEASGLTQEGVDALNQVRTRANLNAYSLSDFSSDSDFRDAVLQERTWELAYEYQHLYDLRRTGKMETVLANQYGKNLQKNIYFFEIPFEEVDRNPEASN